ncbi:uncharacterized protein TNCV_72761 [Trichonephila clavipes]|uniref:Uncharacterized protein n=1 Tax=Trichonephila clavipes TaxID=2585209 RepID=A0A8X6UZS9_TRICX|nr:uncharacterized protein TNCV_72761 [Trichonephila clavipes]
MHSSSGANRPFKDQQWLRILQWTPGKDKRKDRLSMASRVARDKPWSTLCKKSHGIPISPRAAAVAKFRLLTGHDCLCAHLFRFNFVTLPICVLCDTGQDMTAAHLDECSALNDLNCIVFLCGEGGKFFIEDRNLDSGKNSNKEHGLARQCAMYCLRGNENGKILQKAGILEDIVGFGTGINSCNNFNGGHTIFVMVSSVWAVMVTVEGLAAYA